MLPPLACARSPFLLLRKYSVRITPFALGGQPALVPIRGSGEPCTPSPPAPNPLRHPTTAPAPTPTPTSTAISQSRSKSQPSQHPPAKQVRSSCSRGRDLASAHAKPAILGPEIGLEVGSILEHLLHATPPLNTHYLPALPPSLPMTTTPNLDLHDIPLNIRVTIRTHKSATP
jgi:hypothetical protein